MTTRVTPFRWITLAAVFVAASALGGLLKIPSPVGSIAFDSSPGYFIAAYIHPILGGLVGSLGHLASAASAGFPLGFVHVFVSVEMFFWCGAFGLISRIKDARISLIPAAIVATLLNGVVGPLLLGFVGVVDMSLAKGIVVILTIASGANVIVASLAIVLLSLAGSRRKSR